MDIVLSAVTQNGLAIQCANYTLHNNEEVLTAAINQNINAFKETVYNYGYKSYSSYDMDFASFETNKLAFIATAAEIIKKSPHPANEKIVALNELFKLNEAFKDNKEHKTVYEGNQSIIKEALLDVAGTCKPGEITKQRFDEMKAIIEIQHGIPNLFFGSKASRDKNFKALKEYFRVAPPTSEDTEMTTKTRPRPK